ncbi:MAG: electron transport complex subunit RsxA [Planctomycetes bacterium]|nr:electron transport complex subunit RsxA [Planctomycetota bacterium]
MILLLAAVVNNFTLTLFLGICAFIGVSSKVDTALRMGAADTFVLVLTAVAVWFLNRFVLAETPYLRIIAFIVVIAGLVQIVEMIIKKASPTLFRELGIYLPLITTNCAILALAVMQTARGYTLLQGVAFGVGAGLGLTLALLLMASIRERLDLAAVPRTAKGTAIVLVVAGCLSLAFMGFAGLFTAS